MMLRVKDILKEIELYAPLPLQESFDNAGVQVGDINQTATGVLLCLDVTEEVIDEAVKKGAEVVVTHHPLIFAPLTSVESDSLVYKAVKSGVTFISSHTCLDKAIGGVNDCLARKAGITNVQHDTVDEFLKIGEVEPCCAKEFAEKIKAALGGAVAFTDNGKTIRRVAFCSGGGGDLINAAAAMGADALLTGEAKHHEFLEAKHLGVALFAAGHYETEVVACDYLSDILSKEFDDAQVVLFKRAPVNYM